MEPRVILPYAGIAEPVSSLSHLGGGILFCLVALMVLPRVRGNLPRVLAFVAYVFGVGGMFFASGTYHLLDGAHPLHDALWYLDHGMIWLAIAGTISMYLVLECPEATYLQIGLWSIAITGLVCEGWFLRDLAPWASPVLYIAMGWLGFVPFVKILRRRGWGVGGPLLAAGMFCTSGGLVDAFEWPHLMPRVVEAHEVMHVLIFIGMALFKYSVNQCLVLEAADRAKADLAAAQSPA